MRGMTNTMAALAAAAVLGTAGAARAVPEVTNVRMQQRTGTRIVDVWYNLAGEAAIVTLGVETNTLAIPDSAVTRLSGDVSVVIQPGTDRHIVWNAGADWPENVTESAKARVTAWQTNSPPLYCAVDLTGGPSADFYPVTYYTNVDALPYGGLTNEIYKSSYLVMRKILSGAFNMGAGVCAVVLSKDSYAGLFEVTQGQWYQVMGTKPSNFNDVSSWMYRPVEKVTYEDIRGTSAQGGGAWPANDNVYAASFMGRMRVRTGLAGFDLPTEAQWEYACRAGTTTYYNDGLATPANTASNAQMDVLGRYKHNGGQINGTTDPAANCPPVNGTAIVGSYHANDWGLYDMHGNVYEWCLDWYFDPLEGGEDPDGADSGTVRVKRGASWGYAASFCTSSVRASAPANNVNIGNGVRLFRTLP